MKDSKTKRSFDLFDTLSCVHAPRLVNGDEPDINNEVDRLDEDKMMLHILDCTAALAEKQRVRVALKRPLKTKPDGEALTPEQQASRNKVFKAALGLLADGMMHDGNDGSNDAVDGEKRNVAALKLVPNFPDAKKQTDGRGWLPLHWAVAAYVGAGDKPDGVTEADVKAVYALDPLALCRYEVALAFTLSGFTPAHLLCMEATTEQTKSLVRYFSVLRPQSFTMRVRNGTSTTNSPSGPIPQFSALHVACHFGQPTEWLLQHLLQLDSSACRHQLRCSTPLRELCENAVRVDEKLMRCLLAADSSVEVVFDGIWGCLESKVLAKRVDTMTMLLETNPQAAQHVAAHGETLAFVTCSCSHHMMAQECIDVLKLLLAANKDAFKAVAYRSKGWFPVHALATHGPVEALEYLLDACPEVPVTTVSTVSKETLLHRVTFGRSEDQTARVAKARLLCSRYPAIMLQRDSSGKTPLHKACEASAEAGLVLALCKAGGREAASSPVVHPRIAANRDNGWLPLHFMLPLSLRVFHEFRQVDRSPVSPWADAFRILLRLYPEAASVEAGRGGYKTCAYGLAFHEKLPVYYLRLLLRAAPDLNPAELRRLNWAERRQAMFVAFRALSTTPSVLAQLRYENKDLVKHVVSYL